MDKIVIVVEDIHSVVVDYKLYIERACPDIIIAEANNLEDAFGTYEAFLKSKACEIIAIIIDGCVPGDSLNTIPLIEKVASDKRNNLHDAVIVAASSSEYLRNVMVEAGCDRQASKEKAGRLVASLLRQSSN